MKKFHLLGGGYFYADDIDDAFLKLAQHFISMALGEDSNLFESDTEITLKLLEGGD